MQLERTAIALRPRGAWEAVDLGFAMVRRFAVPLYATWLLLVLPVGIAANLAGYGHPGMVALLVWWLEPAFERVPLAILAGAVFDDVPTPGAALRRFPRLLLDTYVRAPHALRNLALDLTWRRLLPYRSYTMPVGLLEGQAGRARQARVRVLEAEQQGVALVLTIVCASAEVLVLFGVYFLVALLLPDELDLDPFAYFRAGAHEPLWASTLHNLLVLTAMAAIEPFYVAGGFALYLNRRVALEAWDVELVLRRLAARLRVGALTAGLVALLVASAPAIVRAGPSPAAVPDGAPAAVSSASEPDIAGALERVRRTEGLDEHEDRWTWRLRLDSKPDQKPWVLWEPLLALVRFLARLSIWLVILVLSVLLALVVIQAVRRTRGAAVPRRGSSTAPPAKLMGLPVAPEDLPDDVLGTARALRSKDPLGAMRLLYGGVLSYLIHERAVALPASATEAECQRYAHAALRDAALDVDLRETTRAWLESAYAGRHPDAAAFDALAGRWAERLVPDARPRRAP